MQEMIRLENPEPFVPVDQWVETEEDKYLIHGKGYIAIPVLSKMYGFSDVQYISYFYLSPKRSYNDENMREHCTHYLNYFLRFYDRDKELLSVYSYIKYMIDYNNESYNDEQFIHDIQKYFLTGSLNMKFEFMNQANYGLELTYRNKKNPALQYTDTHGRILMKSSLIMNAIIPLVIHYIYTKKIDNSTNFLLKVYDHILHMYPEVDIYNKLYETAISNVGRNAKYHELLWEMQDIRGIDTVTHSLSCVNNIILNIMPKYTYDNNIIYFNYTSILNNTGFQITDIGYEYQFVSLSSSKRDQDNNSEFDKFEAYHTKEDEALYLQNKVNAEDTMHKIEMMFGPFNPEEVALYVRELSVDGVFQINDFQKRLIFSLFYKIFGDTISLKAINRDDYVKLIISARKILEAHGMVVLPHIISGKVLRLVQRKNLNKKEYTKLESSPYYEFIKRKYENNEKIEQEIMSTIAAILSSSFQIIDFNEPSIHGKKVEMYPEYIIEEVMMYMTIV